METVQRGSSAIQRPTTHTAQPRASNAPRSASASAPVDRWVVGEGLRETPTTVVGAPGAVVPEGVAVAVAVGVVEVGGTVVVGTLAVGVGVVGVAPGATVPGWAPLAGLAAAGVGAVDVVVAPGTCADPGMGIPAILC